MIDTNKLREAWFDYDASQFVNDPEAIYWSDSVAVTVLCDEIDRLRNEVMRLNAIISPESAG